MSRKRWRGSRSRSKGFGRPASGVSRLTRHPPDAGRLKPATASRRRTRNYTSIPTDLINSSAFDFVTTPGRIR